MPHHQVGDRFATVDGRVLLDDVRTHQPQRVQQAGAARIEPDRAQAQLRAGHDGRRDQEEGGRGEIRRHRHVGGAQALAAAQPGEAGRELDLHTEGREHALGVVAGRVRFGHRGFAVRVQAGQQDRRLHLGAGHRQRVVDACQRLPAVDVQRRGTVVAGVDPRAHQRQRGGDPAHRPLRQRRVADQHAVEGLGGQQAGQQAHAGAGVAAVQRAIGRAQAVHADPVHDPARGRRRLDAHAHPREDRRGGAGVLALQETVDGGHPVGQGGEHHRPVRDRLVARNVQAATQRLPGACDPVWRLRHLRGHYGTATG